MKQPKDRPNIIFILSDQQRWDTLGCYGQRLNVTPNLDPLADRGVRFERAFSCQRVCGPARACLQTGKYATELGCFRNGMPLPRDQETLAHHLGDVGYELGYVGKWHLATDHSQLEKGVTDPGASRSALHDYHDAPVPPERRGGYRDYWVASDVLEFTSHGYGGHLYNGEMERVDFDGYRVDAVTDFALEFIRKPRDHAPFFLFLSYTEPHHQNDHGHYEGPAGSSDRFGAFEAPGDLAGQEGDWREEYPDYLGCCSSIDQNVGRILEEIKRLGIEEETVLIYASDHGSHFRTRNHNLEVGNFDDYKRAAHDAAIHVPLIIAGSGFQGGRVVQELVSLIDLPPTVLALAGIEPPASMRGHELQTLLSDDVRDWPKEVFVQISESQVGRAIRTERYKYSVRAIGKSGVEVASSDTYYDDLLYDLVKDPFELNNLADDPAHHEVRQMLAETLKRRMVAAGEGAPAILPRPAA